MGREERETNWEKGGKRKVVLLTRSLSHYIRQFSYLKASIEEKKKEEKKKMGKWLFLWTEETMHGFKASKSITP